MLSLVNLLLYWKCTVPKVRQGHQEYKALPGRKAHLGQAVLAGVFLFSLLGGNTNLE